MAVIQKIRELVPQLEADCVMSDWEQAARNTVKRVYPGIRVNGCWFHYTQAIWRKTQSVVWLRLTEEIPNVHHSLRRY